MLYGIQALVAATAGALLAGQAGAASGSTADFAVAEPMLATEPLLVDPAPPEPPPARPLGRFGEPAPGDAPAAEAPAATSPVANPYATIVWDESPEAAHAAVPAGAPVQVGEASWYGAYFHGRQTASGEIYDMHASTVAHPTWPLGAVIRIQNLRNGRTALARITDRGPYARGRILDCSYAIAEMLGFLHAGSTDVQITLLDAGRDAWKRFDNRLAPAAPRAARAKRLGPPAPVEVAAALAAIEDTAPAVPSVAEPAVTGAAVAGATRRAPVRVASVTPFPAIAHAWRNLSRWLVGTPDRPGEWTRVERRLQHLGLRRLAARIAGF